MYEIWKEIEIPGYFISNLGKLKGRSGKLLKLQINKNGYYTVSLKPNGKNKKAKTIKIHQFVAKAFIPNPINLPYINHKDGNKLNNTINNLEWCTAAENIKHAYKNKLIDKSKLKGLNNPNYKLTKVQIEYIKQYYIPKHRLFGARALSRKFNVHHNRILEVITGKNYSKKQI